MSRQAQSLLCSTLNSLTFRNTPAFFGQYIDPEIIITDDMPEQQSVCFDVQLHFGCRADEGNS